jgi:hypothetical protein
MQVIAGRNAMSIAQLKIAFPVALTGLLAAAPAAAAANTPFFFSTGDPDGLMATASRPASAGNFEIESADDFVITGGTTALTSATFTGLLPLGAPSTDVGEVVVEIYQVFPNLSNVGRTSGAPTFSTPQVPTRVNSPSDVELDSRDTSAGNLSFTTSVLNASFTAANSVQPGGINAKPNQLTHGNGPVTGEEVQFDVDFTQPFDLAAGHYFFVPQVELSTGDFFWLSAPRPIVAPGTPFPPGFTDLQSWTRDQFLEPDWLRVGTDITGQGPFNAAFSLTGETVPESSTWAMLLIGFAGLGFAGYRRSKEARALMI